MSVVEGIVLQNCFWITEDEFSGLRLGERIIVWGTIATSDELTGNFGSALENTSIGDCRLTALFAEKSLQAMFWSFATLSEAERTSRSKAAISESDPQRTWRELLDHLVGAAEGR